MALEKKDFIQIKKIVDKSITSAKNELRDEIRHTVNDSENRVITILSREVTDLAEISKAIMQRIDKFSDLEKRIIRIERKIGIVS